MTEPVLFVIKTTPVLELALCEALATTGHTCVKPEGTAFPPEDSVYIVDESLLGQPMISERAAASLIAIAPDAGRVRPVPPAAVFAKPVRLAAILKAANHILEQRKALRQVNIHGKVFVKVAENMLASSARALPLTDKECALLLYLHARVEGANRQQVLEEVWNLRDGVETNTVETHIARLRKKLEEASEGACTIAISNGMYRITVCLPE